MLVQASSLREAMDIVEGEMAQTMVDYQFMAISEPAIMDIFPYSAEEKEDSTI